jgi:hypothetical protein
MHHKKETTSILIFPHFMYLDTDINPRTSNNPVPCSVPYEKVYSRVILIGQLFTLYEAINEQEYLDTLHNDLFFFLSSGTNEDLTKKILTKHMIKRDAYGERVDKKGVIFVLTHIPLYYLLAFLGRAYSTYKKTYKC